MRGSTGRASTGTPLGCCSFAVGAGAVQHHVVPRDDVTRRLLETVDRRLEGVVLEGLHLPAAVADEMVMVVTA